MTLMLNMCCLVFTWEGDQLKVEKYNDGAKGTSIKAEGMQRIALAYEATHYELVDLPDEIFDEYLRGAAE